jgi:hypothetical protein
MRNGKRDQTRLKTLEYYLRIEDKARAGELSAPQNITTVDRPAPRLPARPERC